MNSELQKKAEALAKSKGYPSWTEMAAWIIDNNLPVSVWQLCESAMNEAYQLAQSEQQQENERLKEALIAVQCDEMHNDLHFTTRKMIYDATHPSPAPQQEVSPPEVETSSLPLSQAWCKGYETATLKLHPIIKEQQQRIAELEAEKLSFHKDLIAEQNKNISLRAKLEAQPSPTVQEPSTEQADSRNQWVKHFNPPFKHAEDSTFILDSHGNIVIEVRGWGHLSNLMTDIKACEVQDQIANHITDILNSSTEHKKEGGGQ
jgi:hypothetical protein